jgi:hypothetical protein
VGVEVMRAAFELMPPMAVGFLLAVGTVIGFLLAEAYR